MATREQKEKAWDNAKKINGKDSDKYREDPYGKIMYKPSYGKSSDMGWDGMLTTLNQKVRVEGILQEIFKR